MFDVEFGSESTDAACQMAFLASNLSFYSSCKCKNVPTMTEGTCSLSGFTFQPKKDGDTPFTPGFPASSPWVTSVGATQVGGLVAGPRLFFCKVGRSTLLALSALSSGARKCACTNVHALSYNIRF